MARIPATRKEDEADVGRSETVGQVDSDYPEAYHHEWRPVAQLNVCAGVYFLADGSAFRNITVRRYTGRVTFAIMAAEPIGGYQTERSC